MTASAAPLTGRPRPRWFPETPHEESVYGLWRAEAATNPGLPRFRDWYIERYPDVDGHASALPAAA